MFAFRFDHAMALALALAAAPSTGAVETLPGFAEETIVSGLSGATAMAAASDGRFFICEQEGTLRVVRDGALLEEPFLGVEVDSSWERGLIGVALDPRFPEEPRLHVVYVASSPYPHHRVSRFTAAGDRAVPGSEVVLLEGDDQTRLGGSMPAGHQGGPIRFGADGKLYIGIGEQTAGSPSARLDTFQGKILRIGADGSIPADNPFAATARGKYRAIWARGLRNPFGIAVDPGTGRIFINDVGGAAWEEINEGVSGADYGWPRSEGPAAGDGERAPVHAYERSAGKSITGGVFYRSAARQFPMELDGMYFFADFEANWIRFLDPERPGSPREFARGLARPVDLVVAPDGSLCSLERNAWVKDGDFRPRTGLLRQFRFTGEVAGVATPRVTPPPPEPLRAGQEGIQVLPAGGTYTGPVTVQLSAAEMPAGSALRYTTDGSEPSGSSPAYREPFSLERSAVVRARVFRGTVPEGPVASADIRIVGERPYGLAFREVVTGLAVTGDPARLPRLLSETGIFRSLEALEPVPGIVPYDVSSPLWSDGALKRRWMALPGRERIGFRAEGEWTFPRGTVLVKHFEMAGTGTGRDRKARRLETRILYVGGENGGYGATYRWRADGSDADLLDDSVVERVATADGAPVSWYYPSRKDCLACHTGAAGFVLGLKTRQLNRSFDYSRARDEQLRTWSYVGMLEDPPREDALSSLGRLAALGDGSASLEERVRSYLDSNCSNCHRPGGSRGFIDARYEVPLSRQAIIDGPLAAGDLEIPGARCVVPGDVTRSILHRRMAKLDVFKMPPLAMERVDEEALSVIASWIEGLEPGR